MRRSGPGEAKDNDHTPRPNKRLSLSGRGGQPGGMLNGGSLSCLRRPQAAA